MGPLGVEGDCFLRIARQRISTMHARAAVERLITVYVSQLCPGRRRVHQPGPWNNHVEGCIVLQGAQSPIPRICSLLVTRHSEQERRGREYRSYSSERTVTADPCAVAAQQLFGAAGAQGTGPHQFILGIIG